MTDFCLFETIRIAEGRAVLLERHLARMTNSARYFSFECDLARLKDAVLEASAADQSPLRLRLTLSRNGAVHVDLGPLPAHTARCLKLSQSRVNSQDPFLYHKTTNREIYDAARDGCDRDTDVVLINERGELTETTIMNIALFREGAWITPPVACGLLPGVLRAELLSRGEIVEGVIPAALVQPGEVIRCFNALRGTFDLPIVT